MDIPNDENCDELRNHGHSRTFIPATIELWVKLLLSADSFEMQLAIAIELLILVRRYKTTIPEATQDAIFHTVDAVRDVLHARGTTWPDALLIWFTNPVTNRTPNTAITFSEN